MYVRARLDRKQAEKDKKNNLRYRQDNNNNNEAERPWAAIGRTKPMEQKGNERCCTASLSNLST